MVSSTGNFKRKPGGKPEAPKGLPKAPVKVAARIKLPPAEAAAWETAGIHCSANERRADEASRDVEAWLKCMFMRERLGEEYGGTVSTVTSLLDLTNDAPEQAPRVQHELTLMVERYLEPYLSAK